MHVAHSSELQRPAMALRQQSTSESTAVMAVAFAICLLILMGSLRYSCSTIMHCRACAWRRAHHPAPMCANKSKMKQRIAVGKCALRAVRAKLLLHDQQAARQKSERVVYSLGTVRPAAHTTTSTCSETMHQSPHRSLHSSERQH